MKMLARYKYLGLLIFPLVILFLSWLEADTRFSRDLSGFFPSDLLSKKERVLYFLGNEDKENKLSQRQKKDLASAIVRSAQRLPLPDGTLLGGFSPNIELFLYTWAKNRTNFSAFASKSNRIGILGLSPEKIKLLESKAGATIDRNFDIYNFNIQYKIALILYKELLSSGLNAKDAYYALFDIPSNSNDWERLETFYAELHKKVIPEN
ncbi:hypothetical protein [Leptospira ognonensis]|nr:hypothetical protein [Leptospira ognonensis]